MPARSKSQQRLFGMVHAYQKGEFQGNRSLRKRIEALSRRISRTDALHFAKTPHKDLPETKSAQMIMRPQDVNQIYHSIPPDVYANTLTPRSSRRRSLLGRVLSGAATGAVTGGIGMGVLGAYLARKAMVTSGVTDTDAILNAMRDSGIRTALMGAKGGAATGAITGVGLSILDKFRSDA